MRIKRFMAGLISCLVMIGCFTTTAHAYTGEETELSETTDTVETEVTEDIEMDENDTPYDMTVEDDGTVTFTMGEYEWSFDPEEISTSEETGTVDVSSSSYLNLRDGSGTEYNIIGHLLPGTQVDVVSGEGGWYQVTVPEQTGYVSGDYLDVVMNSDADEMDAERLSALLGIMADSMNSLDDKATGLTPDGNLTLVDDIGSSSGSGQQFVTLVTKAGNTFYLIIDRDDDGNENVHFLNLVDESDLLALIEEESEKTNIGQLSDIATESETKKQETEDEESGKEESKTEKKSSNMAPLILLVIVMAGGVGGFIYLSATKKKKLKESAKPDPDADYTDDDEEEYELPEEDYSDSPSDNEDESETENNHNEDESDDYSDEDDNLDEGDTDEPL